MWFDFRMKTFVYLSLLVVASIAWGKPQAIKFPKNFRWCASTSAHQIEGNNTASDWWAFEQVPGHIKNGDVSGAASGHWDRVDEDIALMKGMNLTDYRMSVEWAKIEPLQGQYDMGMVEHYRKEILALLANGIRPIVTLHHFTFPNWLAQKGGWEWSGTAESFAKFTELVYSSIAPEVVDWVTINEPMIATLSGYAAGVFPPGEKRPLNKIPPVLIGLLRAHAKAYHVLHSIASTKGKTVRVGMAHAIRTMDPKQRYNPIDILAAHIADDAWNWSIPNALASGRFKLHIIGMVRIDEKIKDLKNTQDFFGINYYSGDLIHMTLSGPQITGHNSTESNDLGWPVYPRGLYRSLKAAASRYPSIPIIITENGAADATDRLRPEFIKTHLAATAQAISEGVKVEGYCHWSLLDNFEWAEGFSPRFGLIEVDYHTLERKPRPSALLYGEIAKKNGFGP